MSWTTNPKWHGKLEVWPKPKPEDVGYPIETINVGWDIGKGDKTVATVINEDGVVVVVKEGEEAKQLIDEWNNKQPTHDPYTNPNTFLYYECDCGEKFDPHVKTFAALNNAVSKTSWRIRWGANGYVPYCPKCVVEKGIE